MTNYLFPFEHVLDKRTGRVSVELMGATDREAVRRETRRRNYRVTLAKPVNMRKRVRVLEAA